MSSKAHLCWTESSTRLSSSACGAAEGSGPESPFGPRQQIYLEPHCKFVPTLGPLHFMNWLSGFIEAWGGRKQSSHIKLKRLSLLLPAEGKVLPVKLAPTLEHRSAFKLANSFWHSSLACMLLQKCLLGSGRGGSKLNTLDRTPGVVRYVYFMCWLISACTCIGWISVWVRGRLFSCTTTQRLDMEGRVRSHRDLNTSQLGEERPLTRRETEKERADSTSGLTQESYVSPDDG